MIAILNEKFVCFAPNWGGNQQDPWFKEAQRKRFDEKSDVQQGGPLWAATSAGTAVKVEGKRSPSLAKALTDVLEVYRALPESQRKPAEEIKEPNRPMPAPPAGGLVLTIYNRPLVRNPQGQYITGLKKDYGGDAWGPHTPQREALWLTEAEWKSLLPERPEKGQALSVPPLLTRRIFLFGLWPHALWVVKDRWRPDSVRQGELKLTVEEVAPDVVRMRVHGSALLVGDTSFNEKEPGPKEHRYDSRLEGILEYDPARKQVRRWDMVALGDYTGRSRAERDFATDRVGLGFSFDLDMSDYEVPPERRRAKPYILGYVFKGNSGKTDLEAQYWDIGKWEEAWKREKR